MRSWDRFPQNPNGISSVKETIRLLHLWNNETDARELVRLLAESGFKFEAKLVKTTTEYVSALVKTTFNLVIADENIAWYKPGEDALSPFEIAQEIAPGVPFLLIANSSPADRESGPGRPVYCLERQRSDQLGPMIRKILRLHVLGRPAHEDRQGQ
jgi:hypothetical protein